MNVKIIAIIAIGAIVISVAAYFLVFNKPAGVSAQSLATTTTTIGVQSALPVPEDGAVPETIIPQDSTQQESAPLGAGLPDGLTPP